MGCYPISKYKINRIKERIDESCMYLIKYAAYCVFNGKFITLNTKFRVPEVKTKRVNFSGINC